jgi:hypothetical protein
MKFAQVDSGIRRRFVAPVEIAKDYADIGIMPTTAPR